MLALVTGCAGFIGSHLSERLLADGVRVVGVDALTDYYPKRMKRRNLKNLLAHPRFEFRQGDLNRLDLDDLTSEAEIIFHQAAQPGVRASWGQSFNIYIECNIRATQKLLEAVKGSKRLKKFVFASSSSVYGNVDELPMRETQRCSPHSPYGVTKLASENLCRLYHANYGLPTVSLRYFTVYGPRQRPDMAFHRFINAALTGQPLRMFGDGKQSRDFTFISDIVAANIAAAHKGRSGAIYNLGGGSRVTLKEAMITLARAAGVRLRIDRQAKSQGDVDHTAADTSSARKELGFKPGTTLAEGLLAQIGWHRQMREEGGIS